MKKYVKIELKFHSSMLGEQIKLFQNDKLIWLMKVENPENLTEISYRNIIIDDNDGELLVDFAFDSKLTISSEPVITKAQREYDKKFNIQEENGLYFAVAGNTEGPVKMLVTFPGYMFSTSEVQYPITFFRSIQSNEIIKEKYIILAFQDRYFNSGSYMLFDENNNLLKPRIEEKIKSLANTYNISDEDIILFGASKGGTIAINVAENFKSSSLFVSVPQMDIGYYLEQNTLLSDSNKLVFENREFPNIANQYDKYMQEKRNIIHFLSTNDCDSNASFNYELCNNENSYILVSNALHGAVTGANIGIIELLLEHTEADNVPFLLSNIISTEDGINVKMRIDNKFEINSFKSGYILLNGETKKFIYPLRFIKMSGQNILQISGKLIDVNSIKSSNSTQVFIKTEDGTFTGTDIQIMEKLKKWAENA